MLRFILVAALTAAPLHAGSPDRCFQLDSLPGSSRELARSILQEFADNEGLYTLGGGLKPVSSGRSITFRVAPAPDAARLDTLEQWRALLPVLRCGELMTVVQRYASRMPAGSPDTVRWAATIIVVHRGSLKREIERHLPFWQSIGITPSSTPEEVLHRVEHADRADRWRGYGYVFGYPDGAVDFFVTAGLRGDSLGMIVPRDFRRIETWRKFATQPGGPPDGSNFVYAVPKGAPDTPADIRLREAAAPIYAEYAALRIDSTRAIEVRLREWPRLRDSR